MYKLTIFTPTYNRKHLLSRVYTSLINQTYKNFQWVIIDDGSTDETKKLVDLWKEESVIDIQYEFQKNQGKHVAFNRAIEIADSELFICIDSDDFYESFAFEELVIYWDGIENKSNYSSVCYLAKSSNEVVGTTFPSNEMDSDLISIRYLHNVKGDKGIMFKTNVLKEFKFKVFKGEKFLTESSLYGEIGLKYQTRFINKTYQVIEYQSNGLSSNYRKLIKMNPRGALHNYEILLVFRQRFLMQLKTYSQFVRFSLTNNIKYKYVYGKFPNKIFGFFVTPIGILLFLNDEIKKVI